MHHSTVLHDPKAVSTPSQLAEQLARKRRLERLAAAAVPEVVTEVVVSSPAPVSKPKTGEELIAEWTERQKERFKEPWFSIVDEISERAQQRVNVLKIQMATARYYNVSRADILSHRRTNNVVKPRQIAMYLCKVLTMKSLPEIGRMFDGRDHTTILHAVKKIESLIAKDAVLASEVGSIKVTVLGGSVSSEASE